MSVKGSAALAATPAGPACRMRGPRTARARAGLPPSRPARPCAAPLDAAQQERHRRSGELAHRAATVSLAWLRHLRREIGFRWEAPSRAPQVRILRLALEAR